MRRRELLAAALLFPAFAQPVLERLEVVAENVTTGDGGNSWGPHKSRIVRTSAGVFTVYTTDGGGYLAREWHLAQRTADGWRNIAQGTAGREPANLLAAPDGQLHIIAWPQGLPRLWSSPQFHDSAIPGDWKQNDWPYHAAAIDPGGNLYVLVSYGEMPGEFRLARYDVHAGDWQFNRLNTDYRYCYAFLFGEKDGRYSWVATRDVRWEKLGWTAPPNVFAYVFDGVKYWNSSGLERLIREEPQTASFAYVEAFHREAYVDPRGRMHVLYGLRGESTQGKSTSRHAILDPGGSVLRDVELPASGLWRIIQDSRGRFYLMLPTNAGLRLYPGDNEDGTQLGPPVNLPFQGHLVAGQINLAAPRSGVPLAGVVDGAFLSVANEWVHFRLRLHAAERRTRP